MRQIPLFVAVSLVALPVLAQDGPVPANRITPYMLQEIEQQYPAKAAQCLKDSLLKAEDSGYDYIFTFDFQLGQLWLISLASLENPEVPTYICTPDGLADSPKAMMEAIMAGRMGMPF